MKKQRLKAKKGRLFGWLIGVSLLSISSISELVHAYELGQKGPAGGWVFYVSEDGLHGLEAAPVDQGEAEWGCNTQNIIGAQSDAVDTGAQNTTAILNGCDEGGIAARIADNYVSPSGHDDWFLPSKDELDLMYTRLHKVGLGDLDNGGYWSSSDTVSNLTWFQFFHSGDQSYGSKNFALRVRAVRTF